MSKVEKVVPIKELSEADKAKESLRKDMAERRDRCISGIKKLLQDNKCTLSPKMTITAERIIPDIDIIPL